MASAPVGDDDWYTKENYDEDWIPISQKHRVSSDTLQLSPRQKSDIYEIFIRYTDHTVLKIGEISDQKKKK